MDLLQLSYFRAVARSEHMTRAAEELGIAQPSLSKTIARLEEELGVELFDRQGRGIQLNQFGRVLAVRVERIFAELEEAKRELADLAGSSQGHIALASTSTPILPDLLKTFRASHPEIRFRLYQNPTPAMLHQLENGEIDLCIVSPLVDLPGICCLPLREEEILLMVPVGHRLASRSSVDLSELAYEEFVSLRPGYSIRDITDDLCRRVGFIPNVAFEGDEPSSLRNLAMAGLGIAFVSASSLNNWTSTLVRPLHIDYPPCRRSIGLAWLEKRYLSLAACQFRQFVIDYFARLSQR
ncbi:MAG TPA: LysR family transcriptional regulator [Ktedonobacteraceae bacterium]|nr:LysR family transcriptional regulator [Ktedonobacteraceae bacterium]